MSTKIYPIPRNDICMSDAMPFAQHFEARVPVAIAELGDVGLALHAGFSSFRPGDQVIVCSYEDRSWSQLTEVATFRIASTENNRLKTLQVGETVKLPKAKAIKTAKPDEPLKVVPVNNTFEVRDGAGNTIETFVERKQAEAYAASYGPARAGKAAA